MGQSAAILGCAGLTLSPEERSFFAAAQPWGFILFARNIDTPDQVRALVADLRTCVGRVAPVLIDQEGGRVQRLRAPHWDEHIPPLDEAARGARAMWLRSALIGAELADLDIDVNCAPCADIAGRATHPFLHNRCYGQDADTVVTMARAVVDGMAAAGVMPVLKHIPGHGSASADSHHDLPRVATEAQTLRATDFAPFKALNDLPMAMTAHIVYEALDPERAATLSPIVLGEIRQDIGFDGLLMTDDISMKALSGTVGELSRRSLAAGCDLILHCNAGMDEMQAVIEAAGALGSLAQARADAVIAARPTPANLDIHALRAEFQAFASG